MSPEATKEDAAQWFAQYGDQARPLGNWWQLLADSGWAFPSWPEGFGGRDLSSAATKAALQARREAGAFGPPNGVSTFLAAPTIMHYGTEEQQAKYLPRIVSGRDIWCQLFSEPGAGSDMAGLFSELGPGPFLSSGRAIFCARVGPLSKHGPCHLGKA